MISASIDFHFQNGVKDWLGDNCIDFSLVSDYDTHHTFKAGILINDGDNINSEQLDQLLGEAVSIQYGANKNGQFVGFIDRLDIGWNKDGKRVLVLHGYSPTKLLDYGYHVRCFKQKSLEETINSLTKRYGNWLGNQTVAGQELGRYKVDWAMQTEESDYNFLKRLSDRFGMECFYDGTQLRITPLSRLESDTISLSREENKNLLFATVSLDVAPIDFTLYTQDYTSQQAHAVNSPNVSLNHNPLVELAVRKSRVYGHQNVSTTGQYSYALSRQMAEGMQSKNLAQLVTIAGSSTEEQLRVGARIQIELDDSTLPGMINTGVYVITTVTHTFDSSGYKNTFTAVPANLPYGLKSSYRRPNPKLLTAEVASTQTDELGRISVIFQADENQITSLPIPVRQQCGGFYGIPIQGKYVVVQANGSSDADLWVTGEYFHAQDTNDWPEDTGGIRGAGYGLVFEKMNKRAAIYADTIDQNGQRSINIDGQKIYLACDRAKTI